MKKINLEALHYYLSYKHIPVPLSIFEDVSKSTSIDLSHFKFSPIHNLSEEEVLNKMDEILKRAIKKMLKGRVGFLTSGGIDSGIITAIASKLSDKPINTFALIYSKDEETEGKRKDREYARRISEIYKTNHRETILNLKDIEESLSNILYHIGEPFSGYVSMYFLAKFAKKYVDIVLTGDFGDELFGSYKIHRLAYQNPSEDPWSIVYSKAVFTDEEKKYLYSEKVREKTEKYSTLNHLKNYFQNLSATDSLNRMLEFEFRAFFPDHTFMSMDRLSRTHSLGAKTPYSDPEFVELMVKTPGEFKMKGGIAKYLAKQLASRYLPEEIVSREKEGFITPTLLLVQKLESYVKKTLCTENLEKHGLFNNQYIKKLIDDFYKKGGEELSYKIWNLLSFQVWYETYRENLT